jgi:hypothetical protein
MEGLKNIKNYIYSKGIMSTINPATKTLTGIWKGKAFKIYYNKKNYNAGRKIRPQVVLDYGGKLYYPKNNIVLGSILK